MRKKSIVKELTGVTSVNDYIENITRPIFEKALKEMPINRMSVGGPSVERQDISLYQPHNYRLYFDFNKADFKNLPFIKTEVNTSVVTTDYEYKLKNSTEHYYKNYHGCNITVKKTQIEVINKIEHKRWYVIKHGEISEYTAQIKAIIETKDKQCKEVLKKFIKEFGGKSNFKILNRKSEDKVKLEDSIDKIGPKNHFHSATSKKVYNEENIEFNDPVFAVNYFENRAIEKVAPELLTEFNKLSNLLFVKVDGLSYLKKNFKEISDIKKYFSIIKELSESDYKSFSKWLFKKFSLGGENGKRRTTTI